jgi:hypothetical protein
MMQLGHTKCGNPLYPLYTKLSITSAETSRTPMSCSTGRRTWKAGDEGCRQVGPAHARSKETGELAAPGEGAEAPPPGKAAPREAATARPPDIRHCARSIQASCFE